jgi:hypothetical protein
MPKVLKAGAAGGKGKKKVNKIFNIFHRRSGQKLNLRINLITPSSGLNQYGINYPKTLLPKKHSSPLPSFLKNSKSMCNNLYFLLSVH